jgi:hypothetical protein
VRRTRFIHALLLLIQASWVWFISHSLKRLANGRALNSATMNRNEHSRIVFSASSNDAITPRTAAGRKSSI